MIYDFPTNYEEKIDQATKLMEKGYIDQAICLLEDFLEYGAMGYVVIEMRELSKTFLIEGNKFLETVKGLNRKSIPIELLEEIGMEAGEDLQGLKTFIKALTNYNK